MIGSAYEWPRIPPDERRLVATAAAVVVAGTLAWGILLVALVWGCA
jgi:hypothetical protein